MVTGRIDGQVAEDGILRLELPVDFANTELEIVMVNQPKEQRGWPVDYFDRTTGSLAEFPLERPAQREFETCDALA